ncbi:MAG: transporter substrate-binding domain-containing protein [Bacteroidaceae bacterium]
MRLRTVLFFVTFLFFSGVWVQNTHSSTLSPIRFVGDASFPPYEFLNEDGDADGFNVDVIRAIMNELRLPYSITLQTWHKTMDDFETGRADFLSGLSYTPQMAKMHRFSNPYAYLNICIVSRINDSLTTVQQLKGKKVAVLQMSTIVTLLKKIKKEKGLDLLSNSIFLDDMKVGLIRLSRGECDAAICSNIIAQYLIHLNGLDNLELHPMNTPVLNYCMVGKADKDSMIAILNQGLTRIKEKGVYSKITQRWFGGYEEPFLLRYWKELTLSVGVVFLLVMVLLALTRRQVQKATRKIQLLYDENYTVLRSLSIGVLVCSRDGMPQFLNDALCRMLGIKDLKARLSNPLNFYDRKDVKDFFKERIRNGEEFSEVIEVSIFRATATDETHELAMEPAYLHASVIQLRDEDGHIDRFVLTIEDITDNYLKTQQLKEYRYKTNLAIKSGGLTQWSYDCATQYYFLSNSELSEEMDCLTTAAYYPNVHPVDLPLLQKITEMMNNRENRSFSENIRVRKDKSHPWQHETITGTPIMDAKREVVKYTGFWKNNTEWVELNQKIRSSNKMLQQAIAVSRIVPILYNITTQRLFITAPEMKSDYDVFDMIQNGVSFDFTIAHTHPEDREPLRTMFQNLCDKKVEIGNVRIRYDVKGVYDKVFDLNMMVSEMDEKGVVLKIVGYLQDVTEKLQREMELYRKEEFLTSVLNDIPVPVHIKDYENGGKYIYWNTASVSLFGDATFKTTESVVEPELAEQINATDRQVYETEQPYMGLEQTTLIDGRHYEMIVKKHVVWRNNKKMILIVRWDVSEQNLLQRRSKNLTRSIAELNAFTWSCDLRNKVIHFDDNFEVTGGDRQQLSSFEALAQRIHPEEQIYYLQSIFDFLKQDTGEITLSHRIDFNHTGIYKWWECRGVIESITEKGVQHKQIHGLYINIEEHKNLQQELETAKLKSEKASRLLNEILRHIPCGIYIKDVDDHNRFMIVNDEFARIHGEEQSFFIGRNHAELLEESVIPFFNKADEQAISMDGATLRMLIPFSWKGKKLNVEITKTLLVTADGHRYIIGTYQDVTERVKVQSELKEAKERAEESDRLKSAFLANMSHEIRTPLNAIVGFSELLSNSEEEKDRQEYMGIISRNNELLLRLIGDILDLSKIESGMMEFKAKREDLATIFNDTYLAFQQKIKNDQVQLLNGAPSYKHCYCVLDKNRALQVGTNFLTNAVKYTPKGYIKMGYTVENGGVTIWVEDTGIGIAKEKQGKVFERFEKLDTFAQGTGLGMSICKAIMDTIGGKIGFESKEGQGSYFWAWFPGKVDVEEL